VGDVVSSIHCKEDNAREFFENERWPTGVICPCCHKQAGVSRLKGTSQGSGWYFCNLCHGRKFNVRTGTIMERSHIPLTKWVLGLRMMAASESGVSAKEMQRMLGLSYKTARFFTMRIRAVVSTNEVEADARFMSGVRSAIATPPSPFTGKRQGAHRS
jgi:transposase-like protein